MRSLWLQPPSKSSDIPINWSPLCSFNFFELKATWTSSRARFSLPCVLGREHDNNNTWSCQYFHCSSCTSTTLASNTIDLPRTWPCISFQASSVAVFSFDTYRNTLFLIINKYEDIHPCWMPLFNLFVRFALSYFIWKIFFSNIF